MNNADARQVKGLFVLLALALVAACTATNVPNLPATQPSPVSLTETIPLAAPGVEMPIPAIGGFSGSIQRRAKQCSSQHHRHCDQLCCEASRGTASPSRRAPHAASP
jgi:hypothetical protein